MVIPLVGNGQSGLFNKVKQKVKDRVEQNIDNGIDKALDKTEEEIKKPVSTKGSKDRPGNTSAEANNARASNANNDRSSNANGDRSSKVNNGNSAETIKADTSIHLFSRYDFVPGEQAVYVEDFSEDVIGEFPLKWFTTNKGEVVKHGSGGQQWFRLLPGGKFVSPALTSLPEDFTMEFDLLLQYNHEDQGYPYPNIHLGMLELPAADAKARNYFNKQETRAEMIVEISPAEEGTSMVNFRSGWGGTQYLSNDWKTMKSFDSYFGKPIHVSVWIQKERIRCWINSEKIYDIPNGIPAKVSFNHIVLETEPSMYTEQQLGMYVTNFRIAQGMPDLRSKLITEGKLITNGILFDVASDRIKPESAGILKEIAAVLKEHPAIKIKIVGHTDSDGEVNFNQELSRRRAAAVKQVLSNTYSIEEGRMVTDGMGSSKPVADNGTKEGKLKNRRVEFIRL